MLVNVCPKEPVFIVVKLCYLVINDLAVPVKYLNLAWPCNRGAVSRDHATAAATAAAGVFGKRILCFTVYGVRFVDAIFIC